MQKKRKSLTLWLIITIVFLAEIALVMCNQDIKICSQCIMVYILNFNLLNATSKYDQHLLQIVQKSEEKLIYNQTLTRLKQTANSNLEKRIQIHNFQQIDIQVRINIYTQTSLLDQLTFKQLVQQQQIIPKSIHYGIIMLKNNLNMLPFNLISQKNKKIVVQQSKTKLSIVKYDYQPFLDTFWNEHDQDQVILNWLPYFSRCKYRTSSRIYLQDVINPWQIEDYDFHSIQTLCSNTQSWFWGHSLQCRDKLIYIKCVLQQLNVKNTKKQPWWQNTAQKLFYFINSQVVSNSILELDKPGNLANLAYQYYNNLIQIQYTPFFDLNTQIPNKFILHIKIQAIQNVTQLKILQAKLQAYRTKQQQGINQIQGNGQALVNLQIQYLSNIQTFLLYGKPAYFYVITFFLIVLLFQSLTILVVHVMEIKLNFILIRKLIIFPILKGFFIAFFLVVPFFLLFFFIASITNYVAISTNFNGDLMSSNQLWNSYAGRVGLTTFFVGYFLLNSGIQQSFKVLTQQQIKILIEDDQLLNRRQHKPLQPENSQQEDRTKFIVKNMNSHRKHTFICVFISSFILILLYYAQTNLNMSGKFIFIIFGCPLIHKMTIVMFRHLACKQLLYLSPILVTYKSISDLIIIGDIILWKTVLLYFVKLFSEVFLYTGLQILCDFICYKTSKYIKSRQRSQNPSGFYKLLLHFEKQISSILNECRYQKSIFYLNLINIRFVSILVRPFMLLLIFISIKYNFICKQFNQTLDSLIKTSTVFLCFIPLDVTIIPLIIKFFEKKLDLQIIKTLQFNKFKFNSRKVKWINDSFVQNKCIQYFYREFQKFCFSSQLYLHMFIVSFSILIIFIGIKIILQVNYVSFLDPVMLLILIVVWLTGNLLSIILSFIVIKLKFYQKKQDSKMKAKLENIQKILKRSDYTQYLQLQVVKNYFLFHCKQWIVENIAKIFNKDDFFSNNYQFLMKYKHYKSLLKKKQIQQRKRMEKRNQQKYIKSIQQKQKVEKQVIKFPKKQLNQIAKPLILSWLYIAKQFTFLKSLVINLKDELKKQTCQFCSMNIQLQVIQKIQFANIVNQYRILNVGRAFFEAHFIEFYKYKQQFITVCIQCKDKKLYLEKKHLDVNGSPRKLLQKWLIIARSRVLHQKRSCMIRQKKKLEVNRII